MPLISVNVRKAIAILCLAVTANAVVAVPASAQVAMPAPGPTPSGAVPAANGEVDTATLPALPPAIANAIRAARLPAGALG